MPEDIQRVPHPRVTGADIPEELFEHILWHTTYIHLELFGKDTPATPPSQDPAVSALTTLVQVCRHFANVCRPWLYRELSLRNRRQLKALLDLLSSGCCPLGTHLLAFTDSLLVGTGEDDTLWIHQVATVLIPAIQHAGIRPIQRVDLKVDRPLPGLVPNRSQLPRTIPASLLLNITSLLLEGIRFPRGEDLLRCLASFGDLRSVTLRACLCGTVAAPLALARFPIYSGSFDVDVEDWACFATVLPAILDAHARYRGISILTRDQGEFQVFVETVALLCDQFMPHTALRRFGIITQALFTVHWQAIDPEENIPAPLARNQDIDERFILLLFPTGDTRYNIIFRIPHLPMSEDSKNATLLRTIWRQLADCIARLENIGVFQVQFKSPEQMEIFGMAIRPAVDEMPSASRSVEFGVDEMGKKINWETVECVLQRIQEKEANESADGQSSVVPGRSEGASGSADDDLAGSLSGLESDA